ncbi:MAG: GNAT family N-acetyltransferase [Clostridia bacterium]|nr:GNAT family N-acetyltransferase [Clostridia bacterium]
MNLELISYPKYKKNIKELYLCSFPKNERFPFWILKECSKEDKSNLYAVLDNDTFIGMCFIVDCDDANYLMYLAVEPQFRNKKYGSKILLDLKEKYKTLFLSIEFPIDNIGIRRRNFYLNNGFYNTNKIYEDTGVCYQVLCTNKDYKITNENMKKRYTNMSNKPNLLKEISNIFNTYKINLKEIKS